jgi:hypothetical protein
MYAYFKNGTDNPVFYVIPFKSDDLSDDDGFNIQKFNEIKLTNENCRFKTFGVSIVELENTNPELIYLDSRNNIKSALESLIANLNESNIYDAIKFIKNLNINRIPTKLLNTEFSKYFNSKTDYTMWDTMKEKPEYSGWRQKKRAFNLKWSRVPEVKNMAKDFEALYPGTESAKVLNDLKKLRKSRTIITKESNANTNTNQPKDDSLSLFKETEIIDSDNDDSDNDDDALLLTFSEKCLNDANYKDAQSQPLVDSNENTSTAVAPPGVASTGVTSPTFMKASSVQKLSNESYPQKKVFVNTFKEDSEALTNIRLYTPLSYMNRKHQPFTKDKVIEMFEILIDKEMHDAATSLLTMLAYSCYYSDYAIIISSTPQFKTLMEKLDYTCRIKYISDKVYIYLDKYYK